MHNENINSYRTKFYLALSIIAGLFLAMVSTQSFGHSNCQSYEEQLSASGLTPFGVFNGGASVSFGGNTPEQALAGSVIMGSANFDPTNPGPIVLKRAGELIFAPGITGIPNVLTVIVKSAGTPTGPNTFDINGRLRFTGGVGKFEHARGKAKMTGSATVDLVTGLTQLTATLEGKICGIAD